MEKSNVYPGYGRISTRHKSKGGTIDTKVKYSIHYWVLLYRKITQRTQFFHSRTLLLDKTVTTHDLSIVPFQWYFKEVWQKAFKFILKYTRYTHTHTWSSIFFLIFFFPRTVLRERRSVCYLCILVKHHGIPKTTLVNPLTLYNVSDRRT